MTQDVLIFGYGSLISSEARAMTSPIASAWPVNVSGYSRFWNNFPGTRHSVLAAIPEPGARCNGVLFRANQEELKLFDIREFYYTKHELLPEQIEYLCSEKQELRTIIYVPKTIELPNQEVPIVQSYLDVALKGCLEYSEEFALDFLATTFCWTQSCTNDRDKPRYIRAFDSSAWHEQIDRLILQVRGT